MSDASLEATAYEPIPLPDRRHFSDAEMAEQARSFLDVMKKRHTVRDFSDQPVPRRSAQSAVSPRRPSNR